MKGYLYIIQSQKNNRYYIGSTNSWKRRIQEHNEGKSPYTRTTRPWKLVYLQEFETVGEARKRELYLKKLKSRKVIEDLIKEKLNKRA